MKKLHCSFCGKDQGTVKLIAGPNVWICNECVAICNEILKNENPGPSVSGHPKDHPGQGKPNASVTDYCTE